MIKCTSIITDIYEDTTLEKIKESLSHFSFYYLLYEDEEKLIYQIKLITKEFNQKQIVIYEKI